MSFYILLEDKTYHNTNLQMGKLSFTPVWPLITKRVDPEAVQLRGTEVNGEVLQQKR